MRLTYHHYITRIRKRQKALQKCSDVELKKLGLDLKYLAMSQAEIKKLVPDAFALVVEAARRQLGIMHYDVQLECGIQMAFGKIAEMKTGEGKTLTATLVAYLFALYGRGVHVITFNDYLAERDCESLIPVYESLGLTCGFLSDGMTPEEKKDVYRRDISYGSAKEFGFDFLRDRMAMSRTGNTKSGVTRGTHFAVVDEADSVMIDEARTPLVIGMVNETEHQINRACCAWAAKHPAKFVQNIDYTYAELKKTIDLTSAGIHKCRNLPETAVTRQISIQQLYGYIKNAIKVHRDFHLDKNYAVINDEIVIIDEFTGRPAEGRQWQQGIHQAVQAKEGLEITAPTRQAATITIQAYFNLYTQLSGMTGTAYTSRREFKKVYGKTVAKIPTHLPTRRRQLPTQVYHTNLEKYAAIADEVALLVAKGRAILIGNRSVGASEMLSAALTEKQIEHVVLNAKLLEKEAEIVEVAGQPGRVTVATNMAGRGTDIKLHPDVKATGGLHVILTEFHESQRIDWQLIGRGSRQGDPGTYRICVSLEDEILSLGLQPGPAERIKEKFGTRGRIHTAAALKYFRLAQRKTERRFLVDRLIVLKQDVERQKNHFDTGQDPYLNVVST